jgi:hypothetical protein
MSRHLVSLQSRRAKRTRIRKPMNCHVNRSLKMQTQVLSARPD